MRIIMITAMIPTIAPIKVHTTKYAKNGSSIMRNQKRSQNRRHGLFFIAWTPFIPNFIKPFYHFFAASQEMATEASFCLRKSNVKISAPACAGADIKKSL